MPESTPATTGDFTPGPWSVVHVDHGYDVRDAHGIYNVCEIPGDDQHSIHDAHLIAASWNYFQACEWIEAKLAEIGADLATVRDVPITSLMLTQLMEAHAKAKAGQP